MKLFGLGRDPSQSLMASTRKLVVYKISLTVSGRVLNLQTGQTILTAL